MEIRYFKGYSNRMGRDMEFKVYGSCGQACLYFPCQDGRFYDFENFGMLEECRWMIENGMLQVFSVDTVDIQSLSAVWKPQRERLLRQEAYFKYITQELVPWIHEINPSSTGNDGILAMGFSMGAYHAANTFFRRPDLFTKAICCSGLYKISYMFGDYMDEIAYDNSPIDFLKNMPAEHPYIEQYNKNRLIVCVGQGAWEEPMVESTRELEEVLQSKGIRAWIDYWGKDVAHDWCWWKKQVQYFIPKILEG